MSKNHVYYDLGLRKYMILANNQSMLHSNIFMNGCVFYRKGYFSMVSTSANFLSNFLSGMTSSSKISASAMRRLIDHSIHVLPLSLILNRRFFFLQRSHSQISAFLMLTLHQLTAIVFSSSQKGEVF